MSEMIQKTQQNYNQTEKQKEKEQKLKQQRKHMQQQQRKHMQQQQRKHIAEVQLSFINYKEDMIKQYHDLFTNLTSQYWNTLQKKKRQLFIQAIEFNHKLLRDILTFILLEDNRPQIVQQPNATTTKNNFSKIQSTVKQFYRQWAAQSEQKEDLKKCAQKITTYLTPQPSNHVLVPGCGLGRLVLQLVALGYSAQGNQVTYFMLYGSNFILNAIKQKQQYKIYPFIHNTDYYVNNQAYRPIFIPDVLPSSVVNPLSDFSMSAGQFTQIYGKNSIIKFQSIITCFFIDTANNVFDYIDTIYHTLKQKGIWLNYGPLLFHFRQILTQVSIEISWESLRKYIQTKFDFLQEYTNISTYCHDPLAKFRVQYECIMFVCRKKQK